MSDKLFNSVIKELQLIHKINPGLRFGEVIQGSVDCIGVNNANLYDISTKKMLTKLKKFKEDHKERIKKSKKVNYNG